MSMLEIASEMLIKRSKAAESRSGISNVDLLKKLGNDLVLPLLQASDIEKFMEENFDRILEIELDVITKIVKDEEAVNKNIEGQFDEIWILLKDIRKGTIGGAFNLELREKLADVLELELSNDIYMLKLVAGKTYMNLILNSLQISEWLEEAKIDASDLFRIEVKVSALVFAIFYILAMNEASYEGKLSEIVSIANKYAEEKDDYLTVLQIVADKNLKKEVDEAYKEALS